MNGDAKGTDGESVGSNDLLCPTCGYEFNGSDNISIADIFDYACVWGGGIVRHACPDCGKDLIFERTIHETVRAA